MLTKIICKLSAEKNKRKYRKKNETNATRQNKKTNKTNATKCVPKKIYMNFFLIKRIKKKLFERGVLFCFNWFNFLFNKKNKKLFDGFFCFNCFDFLFLDKKNKKRS